MKKRIQKFLLLIYKNHDFDQASTYFDTDFYIYDIEKNKEIREQEEIKITFDTLFQKLEDLNFSYLEFLTQNNYGEFSEFIIALYFDSVISLKIKVYVHYENDLIYIERLDLYDFAAFLKTSNVNTVGISIVTKLLGVTIFEFNVYTKEFRLINNKWLQIMNFNTPMTLNECREQIISKTFNEYIPKINEIFSEENLIKIANGQQALDVIEYRVESKKEISLWILTKVIKSNDQVVVGYIKNIEDDKSEKQKIISKMQKDSMTGLYNREFIEQNINKINQYNVDTRSYLLFIDIDGFKKINDKYGHLFGDTIITSICDALKKVFRQSDLLGRYGGDEFIVYLPGCNSCDVVNQKINILNEEVKNISFDEYKDFQVTLSVGKSCYPDDGMDFKSLVQVADGMMYSNKRGKHYDQSQDVIYSEDKEKFDSVSDLVYDSNQMSFINDLFENIAKTSDYLTAIKRSLDAACLKFKYDYYSVNVYDDKENKFTNFFTSTNENSCYNVNQKIELNYNNQTKDEYNKFNIRYFTQESCDIGDKMYLLKANAKSLFQFKIMFLGKFIGIINLYDAKRIKQFTNNELTFTLVVLRAISDHISTLYIYNNK